MEKTKLVRQLSLFDSSMIMMGIVIGSGIFVTTGIMAQSIPSVPLILLAWIVGGLLTLAGALTFAELGAAMPEAGGLYVYLREAYGPLFGFLFGWILFLVYMTGGIAGLAAAFAEYFGVFFPSLSTKVLIFSKTITIFNKTITYSVSAGQLVAMAVILLLSAVNYVGLIFGKIIQNIFTVIKIGTLILFILFGFTIGKTTSIDFSMNPGGINVTQLFVGFGIALIAVSWAFDGWNNINFMAGEIKNPKRNLPLALIFGTLGITILYVLINMVYLFAIPIDQLAGEVKVAEKASSILFGDFTTIIISIAIIISIFGSINGSILAGPRVYYAMAKDGLFFQKVASVHPKFKVPGFAIFIQAAWSCLLVLSGNFEQLITFTMFISFVFWIAAAASVFKLRKKYPDLPRPYKTWGYPVVPVIFIVATSGILFNTLIEKPFESLAGVGITLIGVPVYYFWKKKAN